MKYRVERLERDFELVLKKLNRVEIWIWYIAGALSINLIDKGAELLPSVVALMIP